MKITVSIKKKNEDEDEDIIPGAVDSCAGLPDTAGCLTLRPVLKDSPPKARRNKENESPLSPPKGIFSETHGFYLSSFLFLHSFSSLGLLDVS